MEKSYERNVIPMESGTKEGESPVMFFFYNFNKSIKIKSKHVWDCMLNISAAMSLWWYISPKSKYFTKTDSEQVVWTTFEK